MAVYQGSTVVKRRPKDGDPGKGISSVQEFYLASSLSSGVTWNTSGWQTNPSQAVLTSTNKYLWNYEQVIYTDGTFSKTDPVIIGTYGKDGKGIQYVIEFYVATSLSSGVTMYNQNWQIDPSLAVLTPTNKYLWNFERIVYTDGTSVETYPVIIGVYGDKGDEGLPGPIVVQKEWVQGDTHRYTDEIKDYIYVRGDSNDTSYWYTLANKGTITAGVKPTGGSVPSGYVAVTWMKDLAVKFLLVEEANLANLIFKDDKLISLRGTVNGVATDYSGQSNFVPNVVIDGKTGEISAVGTLESNKTGNKVVISAENRSILLIDSDGNILTRISFVEDYSWLSFITYYSSGRMRYAASLDTGGLVFSTYADNDNHTLLNSVLYLSGGIIKNGGLQDLTDAQADANLSSGMWYRTGRYVKVKP